MNDTLIGEVSCPQNHIFNPDTLLCQHSIYPFQVNTIIGLVLTFLVGGFSSLTGIAGGAPHLVVLMALYNYSPKHATIVIFSCLLGTTMGNVLSQMKQKINNEPIIQYQYAFISIPILFIGSIIGVLINQIFPTILITGYIMYWVVLSTKDIYKRFIAAYRKQSEQNLDSKSDTSKKYIQTSFNPFECVRNRYIFKNLILLFIVFIFLEFMKGTQKVTSLIGVEKCSIIYWILYLTLFLSMIIYARHNMNVLKQWEEQPKLISNQILEIQGSKVEQNINFVTKNSLLAGIFNGLGRGGGFFLIPAYKSLGCNSIQATSTCSFTIFLSSLLNVIQGVMLGIIGLQDFLALFTASILGSFICSSFLPKYLQRINRVSLIEGALLVMMVLAVINLPISLFLKYQKSGYDFDLLFGFGKLC